MHTNDAIKIIFPKHLVIEKNVPEAILSEKAEYKTVFAV